MLQEIYEYDPNSIVDCVINLIQKRISNKLNEYERKEFRYEYLSKFVITSKKVNTITDLIFNQLKDDTRKRNLDSYQYVAWYFHSPWIHNPISIL
jgi:hypothetical protein